MNALLTLLNRRIRAPYVRWCGRGGAVRLPPIPIRTAARRHIAAAQDACFSLSARNARTGATLSGRQGPSRSCLENPETPTSNDANYLTR